MEKVHARLHRFVHKGEGETTVMLKVPALVIGVWSPDELAILPQEHR